MVEEFRGEIIHGESRYVLDSLDQKIISILGINARFSLSFIAKLVGRRIDVVRYRLSVLKKKGIIPGFATNINMIRLGKVGFLVLFKLKDFLEFDNKLERLVLDDRIGIVQVVGGSWDLRVYVYTDNVKNFNGILEDLILVMGNCVLNYSILHILSNEYAGIKLFGGYDVDNNHFRINKSSFYKEISCSGQEAIDLDHVDQKILGLIQNDARASMKTIAFHVGISVSSIEVRISNMVKSGVICAFFPQVSLVKLGYQWYKVLFRIKPDRFDKFYAHLKTHPNVTFCTTFIGEYNIQASVFVEDQKKFYDVLNGIRSMFSGDISGYETMIVFEQKKNKVFVG